MAVCMSGKILIVDDEKGILNLISKVLRQKNYTVEISMNGTDAVKKLTDKKYDVVVTDIKMPGTVDGMEVLKRVKQLSPDTEVIMITGYGSIESAIESMKLGAYDYILKPFDVDDFQLKIDRVFTLKRLARELEQKHESIKKIEESASHNVGALEVLVNKREGQLRNINRLVKEFSIKSKDSEIKNLIKKIREEIEDIK